MTLLLRCSPRLQHYYLIYYNITKLMDIVEALWDGHMMMCNHMMQKKMFTHEETSFVREFNVYF